LKRFFLTFLLALRACHLIYSRRVNELLGRTDLDVTANFPTVIEAKRRPHFNFAILYYGDHLCAREVGAPRV
jgi:hypothetical protein